MLNVFVQVSKFISARGPQHLWEPDRRITTNADDKLIAGKPVPLVTRDITAEAPTISETSEALSAETKDFEMSI